VTAQWRGKALPAMNAVLPGTTTKDRCDPVKAADSIHVNSEYVSNEIDESDLQSAKQFEQRM
jgi:hypothetical protein